MDCIGDQCSLQTNQIDNSMLAVHLTGVVVLLNSLLPTILWWVWRNPAGKTSQTVAFYQNKIYYYGWTAMWIGHLTVYGLPSLFYLCTFFNVDLIKYIFVMSMNTIQDMPFVMFGFTSLMLVLGAVNRTQGTFSTAEVWSVPSVYIIVSAATGFIQKYFNKTLNRWYFGAQAIN